MMSYINETDFVIENKELVYPEIVTDGLQLYYDAKGKRDTDYHRDTMLDMSVNNNHGKLHNFAYERHSGYKDGLVFDYIDDKLIRPTLDLKPDDFTFMLNGNIISFSPDGTVKRVQDGEVIESKGFNLVRNGDFVDENKGWSISNLVDTIKITKGIATIRAGKQYGGIVQNLHSSNKMPLTGDKYYFCANIERESSNVQLYLNDGRGQTLAVGPNTGFVSNTRTMADNPIALIIKLQDNNTSSWTYSKISNIVVIDLTKSFGAGKEPTKEQMDEIINRLGFIPNAQDLIDRVEYKGNDLGDMENIIDGLYKTEVLSGEEIYTDKADDDAVVHVEVDGKSYQHAGSGKNLATIFRTSAYYTTTNVIIESDNRVALKSVTGNPTISMLKPKNNAFVRASSGQYTVSFEVSDSSIPIRTTILVKDINGDIITSGVSGHGIYNTAYEGFYYEGTHTTRTFTLPENTYSVSVGLQIPHYGRTMENKVFNLQIEEGSTATDYEPPAPSPVYPVKIHSLNDFDVVSSVGKENLWVLNKVVGGFNTPLKESGYIDSGGLNHEMILEPIPTKDKTKITFELWNPNRTVGAGTNRIALLDSQKKPVSFYSIVLTGETYQKQTFNINKVTEFVRLGAIVGKDATSKDEDVRVSFTFGDGVGRHILSSEDITEDTNHPLIDKINLLLSEPLRSIGDIKDRLFRDTDGLWKIERKIGSYTMTGEESLNKGAPSYDGEISTNRFIYPHSSHGKELAGSTNEIRVVSSHLKHQTQGWTRDIPNTCTTNVNQLHMRFDNKLIGVGVDDSEYQRNVKFKQYVKELYESAEPLTFIYRLKKFDIEILDQELQDKLNNLRSFEDSNYVYTVLPNEDNYLSNNLKPTLHAKFLYNNWYKEDRVINNLMIYNRALANEEMLQNYKTIKRRWGM